MLNLNRFWGLGQLTADPELKYIPDGTAIVNFNMAMNRKYKSKDETKEEVCFIGVAMFGRRAEVISEHFSKGDSIYIEGSLKFDQWETEDGQKRSKLSIKADNFEFVGGGKKDG
jgi:single-strand DNA-binding protein